MENLLLNILTLDKNTKIFINLRNFDVFLILILNACKKSLD